MKILNFLRQKKTSSTLIREMVCIGVNQARYSLYKRSIEITMTVPLINLKKFLRKIGKQKPYN